MYSSCVQCSIPVRLGHWQSQTSNFCSEMTGHWSDRSAMLSRKTLSPPNQWANCAAWHRGSGPHSEGEKVSLVWTCMWNAPIVQSRQPLTYRLMESLGLGGQRWHGSSWQRGIAETGSSRLSTLMIDIPGDLVWDLPYVQQASYLKRGPLMWMLPLYLHINQKSVDDDGDDDES